MNYKYTRLEYIESTGNQYIDTGLEACHQFGFDITFMSKNSISATNYGCILGGRYQSSGTGMQEIALTTYRPSVSYKSGALYYRDDVTGAGIIPNQIQKCSFKNKKYNRPNGTTYTFSSQNYNFGHNKILLFAMWNESTTAVVDKSSTVLYDCKLYHGKTLLRHFIPAKRNSDGEIGLYEEVVGEFYTNQGTQPFIAGPSNEAVGKNLSVYTNNWDFGLYANGKQFGIKYGPVHGSTSDDMIANNYINGLSNLTVSYNSSTDILNINFTPCTNEELLNLIADNKTKVRLQLLIHKPSSSHGDSKWQRSTHWHCLKIPAKTYWTNISSHNINSPSNWARTNGRLRNGRDDITGTSPTYVDLSVEQLENGTATLPNISCHVHSTCHNAQYFGYVAIEMFCPALHRPNKDIYYYERINGYYKISNNCISVI